MAGSNTRLSGGTGGLWETEGQGSCRLLGTPCCPPGTFSPFMSPPHILCLHLCVQVGRRRKRSPRGQCRWIPGHRWQVHSHPSSRHSLGHPSHSHTRSGSPQLSSGRCHRFCSEGDSGLHTHLHLQSSPSLQGTGEGTGAGTGSLARMEGGGAAAAPHLLWTTHPSRSLGRGRCRCPAHPGRWPHSGIGA